MEYQRAFLLVGRAIAIVILFALPAISMFDYWYQMSRKTDEPPASAIAGVVFVLWYLFALMVVNFYGYSGQLVITRTMP